MTRETDRIDDRRRTLLKLAALGLPVSSALTALPKNVKAVSESSSSFVVNQGDQQYEVTALSNGESIEEFYDYYNALSHTSTDVEQSDTSLLFFWDGPNGLSLVVLHDKGNDGSGGACTFEFSGLPTDQGHWIIPDDFNDFDSQTDTSPDWTWADTKTDGGVFRGGFDGNFEISIDPRFNDDAVRFPLTPGKITEWQLLSGDPSSPERISLNKGESITIDSVPEDVSPFEAAKDNKLAITAEVDRLAATIDEQSRVKPTLNGLQSAIDTGAVPVPTAVEAVERMILVEDLADLSLAGLSAREAKTKVREDAGSLVGEPEDSVGVDPSVNVLGTTGEFVIEGVLSLLSLASTVSEYVVKLGSSHPVAGKLLDLAGKAADRIDDILGDLGAAESLMGPLIDDIWQNDLKSDLLNGEYETADGFYDDISGAIDGREETISDHMMSEYESGKGQANALDNTLERVDFELSVEDGGPTFSGGAAKDGPLQDASAAATTGRTNIAAVITDAQEKLENNEWVAILLNIIELVIILSAVLVAPSGGASAPIGTAISLIFGLPALVLVLIGIKRGLDAGDEVLNICDEAARAIVDGNSEASL